MVSDELAPLEALVKAQVNHLSAIVRVVRELQSAEKQYADRYAALPLDLPADAKSTLRGLPQLQRVSDDFSQFVRKSSVVKAAVAEDLSKHVIAPLEAFAAEHVEKTQHLLSELYELLQKEKAFDVAYQNLLETCERDHNAGPATDVSAHGDAEVQLHRAHMEQLLRKRDAERLAIQQWITALHFAGQRYETHVRNVLRQVIVVYDSMVTAMAKLADDYQAFGRDANEINSTMKPSSDNNNTVSEDSWEGFLRGYECHVTITSWMSELFKQLVPAELKFAKSMQKAIKLDRALCKAFGGVGFGAQFAAFVQFHGLLTMNISNPIMRTLKFSRQRQERMRNEWVKSLKETQSLVDDARARLNARLAKEKVEEKAPVRCDSMTSSETSDCSMDDNNEEDLKGNNPALQDDALIESSPEQISLETLERKLVLQRQEMAHVLEQTSYLSVKTLELMVQDHVKHVIKALATLKENMQAEECPETTRRTSDVATQPWRHITERLEITVTQPAVANEDNQHQGSSCGKITYRAASQRLLRTCTVHERSEPRSVQVALSAAQTAVSIAAWATTAVFKAARDRLPPSCEERVVLAVIVAMILALLGICIRSSQLQSSWIDLTYTQQSNSDDIVEIVKLSLERCTQVNVVAP